MIDFLLKAYELKDETRSGWVLRGIKDPESVADHSWGTALLCWIYAPAAVNHPEDLSSVASAGAHAETISRDRAVAMALLHDIAEAELGDVATRVHESEQTMTPEEKVEENGKPFSKMVGLLPQAMLGGPGGNSSTTTEDLVELWEEYEEATTATARFVRDMNLCDMCVQALLYERSGRYDAVAGNEAFRHFTRLDEFFETSRPRISTAVGKLLFSNIEKRYAEAIKKSR